MIGRTLGTYRIIEQVGMGGMATVYKAYDPDTDRNVAIKILPEHYKNDTEFYERFRREAKAVARLEHAHILPIYTYGEHEGIAYFVMRFLPTGTLSEYIRKNTPLPFAEISRLLRQVAAALDYAHEQGILHRDVKPSNVLLDKNNNAYLSDFGIARIVESAGDLTGTGILGTPQYMSPEQCQGRKDLTPASDIYSLGVVLYEMVTGRTPFNAETPLATIHMQLNEPLPTPHTLRSDLPELAENVIFKALAKQPEHRYASCTAMADAFERAISTADTQKSQPPKTSSPAPTEPLLATAAQPATYVAQPLPDEKTAAIPKPTPQPRPQVNRWVWIGAAGIAIAAVAGALLLANPPPVPATPSPTPSIPANTPVEETAVSQPTAVPVTAENAAILTFQEHAGEVYTLALGADGSTVASAGAGGEIILWDINTGEVRTRLETGMEGILALAFNPTDPSVLAAAGIPNATLWNIDSGENLRTFEAGVMRAVAFSPDGTQLAIGGDQPVLQLFSLENGFELARLGLGSGLIDVKFSADGRLLAGESGYGEGVLRVWNTADLDAAPQVFTDGGDNASGFTFNADATQVATGLLGGMAVWNVETGELIIQYRAGLYNPQFHPFLPLIASGTDETTIDLSNAETGQLIATLTGHSATVRALGFTPDGARLISGSHDGTLRVWDITAYLTQASASDPETQIDQLTEAISADNENAALYFQRGQIYAASNELEAALNDFNRAIELDDSNPAYYIAHGDLYAAEYDYSTAIDDYDRALELDPDNLTAYLRRGEAYRNTGEYEDSIDDYDRALELDPNNIEAYLGRGLSHSTMGAYSEALDDFTDVIDLDSTNVTAFFERARVQSTIGNYIEAISDYDLLLGSDLIDDDIRYRVLLDRGLAYSYIGTMEAAIADFSAAIELNPAYDEAYDNLARAYASIDDYDSAFATYEQALENASGYTGRILMARGMLYRSLGDYDAALRDYDEAVALLPDGYEAYVGRGDARIEAGLYSEAVEDYDRALELNADGIYVHTQRGYAYLTQGDYEAALSDFNTALERDDAYIPALEGRAETHFNTGDLEAAISDFSRVIELQPDAAVYSYRRRGDAYRELGDTEEALADYSRTLALDPQNLSALQSRAELYTTRGDFEGAVEDYTAAIAVAEEPYDYYVYRGEVYYHLGDYEAAVQDHTRAIEIDPENGWAYVARGYAYMGLEQYDAALADFTLVIDEIQDEDLIWAYQNRGDTYYTLGDAELALADYQAYLELAGDSADDYIIERVEELEGQ